MKIILHLTSSHELEVSGRLTAGALAGITSVATTYPLDIIRTRLSLVETTNGIIRTGSLMVKLEGPWSLYNGLIPTLLGIAPYVALNFTTYETLKKLLLAKNIEVTVMNKLICGGLAGAVAQTFTYPLDVLRRRYQCHTKPDSPYRYHSLLDAVVQIYSSEGGIRAFYKGMLPNLLKVVPSMAVSFVTYEQMKRRLGI